MTGQPCSVRIDASSSKNAVSFSSARTTNRLPSRSAATIQILRLSRSKAENQLKQERSSTFCGDLRRIVSENRITDGFLHNQISRQVRVSGLLMFDTKSRLPAFRQDRKNATPVSRASLFASYKCSAAYEPKSTKADGSDNVNQLALNCASNYHRLDGTILECERD